MAIKTKNLILGAGIAGLGASYALRKRREESVIVEKNDTYGGLCSNFEINGFRFDRFVHLSFSTIPEVNELFNDSCSDIYRHTPNPYNLYKGIWIKHPAQNNLYPLPKVEKELIIQDFMKRPSVDAVKVNNYEDWLRLQFGDYFAEHFPMVYTRKYWMKDAKDLRTEWVGKRVYQPSVDEVIEGCKTAETPVTYYAKEMRYPKKGGYKAFLKHLADVSDIRYGYRADGIDYRNKVVHFENGEVAHYDRLISSLPLPEVINICDAPKEVKEASKKLEATCGYHISIALKNKNIPPYLWWYIYDEKNIASRVYSPSLKSPDNAPEGCGSLQMEVFCKENEYSEDELINRTVGHLVRIGVIRQEDILFTHISFEKYANVIFTEPIYDARKVVRDWLSSIGIETIGRFGEWDYLWSDQSLLSGLKIK
ncbi:MAG: NAD(P)-binding protein [Prevotella sp.]|nr:NAD(P)-binding protein [Prevotella sp.]